MASKSTLKNRLGAPFGQFPINRRDPSSRTTFCRVIVYHYFKQNFGIASHVEGRGRFRSAVLNEVERTVIESDLESVSINKSIGSPSANFDISLHPTKNWKRVIGPGDWVMIYFYNSISTVQAEDMREESDEFTSNCVLVGNVDRIARSTEKDEQSDKIMVRYKMSGRNFGKVFEDTDIWFDPYQNQSNVADAQLRNSGLLIEGGPKFQVDNLLDVFLGKGGQFVGGKTSPLNQWSIPSQLAMGLKGSGAASSGRSGIFFDDVLARQVNKVPGNKTRNMLTLDSNGSLWDMLRRSCNGLINELFLEEIRTSKVIDGRPVNTMTPTIVMRPRPHNTPHLPSQFGDGNDTNLISFLEGSAKTMQDLAKESFVEIARGEILYENLGRDDHSRINQIILSTRNYPDYMRNRAANVNKRGVANPMVLRESVQRYGLQRLDQQLDWTIPKGTTDGKESATENQLFKAFMAQLYDMHYANHLYEAGTIECTGVLEAELGKVLKILPNDAKEKPKIYYIEGYEHQWRFPNTWRTTFTLTKGQFETKGLNIWIDLPATDFGQDDETFDQTFLVKTNVRSK
jgi:hypothetical protein